MEHILDFLRELRLNNNREWFNAHKEQYLDVKRRVELMTAELIAYVAEFDEGAARLGPADCLYRIYRDTRFSADKTPYKTHIGIYINPLGGKKDVHGFGGYYFHIEPGNSFVGGGIWCPTAPVLREIRQSIVDETDEYLEIINNPEFKALYPVIGDNPVKTVPKGFDKNWEHINLLRPRDFTTGHRLTDRQCRSKDILKRVAHEFEILKPFNDFMNYAVEQSIEKQR